MKKLLIFIILHFLIMFNLIYAQETYSLTIKVENLRNSKGVLQFAIYNTEGSIPDEKYKRYFKKVVVTIKDNYAIYTFKKLPKDNYAVNVLHDENMNGKIDKGFMLPKEGIGFSNYSSIGLTNRPKFKKAKFKLDNDLEREIKIIYF